MELSVSEAFSKMSSTLDFDRFFHPDEYLSTYYTNPKEMRFGYQHLIDFWSQHKGKDLRVLEYGGGPVVSRLVSACPYVRDFIYADYLESNLKAVQAWIDKDPKAFDWRPTSQFIIQELEGKGPEDVAEREDELREKIRAIVPCDIRAEKILEVPVGLQDKYAPPYDVVAAAFCFESIVENKQDYKNAWRKLAKLVKPGGYLLMIGVLEETYYMVGPNKFYTFYMEKELVEESMKEAGLKEVKIDLASSHGSFKDDKVFMTADAKDLFFACGRAV